MQGVFGFHAIAAARGDGLRAELLKLLVPPSTHPNVIELASIRPPVRIIAGDASALSHPLPENVAVLAVSPAAEPANTRRRPRVSRARSLSRRER